MGSTNSMRHWKAAELARLNVVSSMSEIDATAIAYRFGTTFCDEKEESVGRRYVVHEKVGRGFRFIFWNVDGVSRS